LIRASYLHVFLLAGLIIVAGAAPSPSVSFGAFQNQSVPAGNAAEIPAEFIGNLIFLPARVNQKQPSLFVLDSTSAASSISPARAAELGLADFHNATLSLPGAQISLPQLASVANENFESQVGRAYEGTLGIDFLSLAVVEIDYARQTVRLYDPATYKFTGQSAPIPFTLSGGVPVVRAKFSVGGEREHEADFVLDTALQPAAILFERYAESHRLFSAHLRTVSISDPEIENGAPVAIGRLHKFQVGRFPVSAPIAAFTRNNPAAGSSAELAGSIGGASLCRFTVTLDFPHHQIFLVPNSHFADQDQEDKSGLSIVAQGSNLKIFRITQVRPETPAAEAGVQKGDIIAGINDEPAADLTLESVRELFRRVGYKYKVLLDRNGQSVEVNLQTRRLL
jgi:PDZ domain